MKKPAEPHPHRAASAPAKAKAAEHKPTTSKARKHRRWRIVLIVVGALILIRIALPYVLLHFMNKKMANMPKYYGHVDDLDLALIRGAYVIKAVNLEKKDTVTQKLTPFISADAIDLSVEWHALFQGSFVGELVVEHPELRFTKDAAEPAAVQKDTADLRSLLNSLMPLKINRLEMHNGVIRYRDPGREPVVDVQIDALELLVLNLTNAADSTNALPSTAQATGKVYGGDLTYNMGLNMLAATTTFDMNMTLVHTDLKRINDFFKAYGNFDVNKGTFGLYAEMATKNNAFQGYVKPVIKDLDVLGPEDKNDGLFQKFWEAVVGAAGGILNNASKEQVATKVTFEGRLDKPQVDAWGAIIEALQNAFIKALPAKLDNQINITTVGKAAPEEKKGFFKKLFGKKDKKEEPKKSKKK